MAYSYRNQNRTIRSRLRKGISGACLFPLLAAPSMVLGDGISIGIGLPIDPITITPPGGDFSLAQDFGQTSPRSGNTLINDSLVQPDGTIVVAGAINLPVAGGPTITISARASKLSMGGLYLGSSHTTAPHPHIERYTSSGEPMNYPEGSNYKSLPLEHGEIRALAIEQDSRLIATGNVQAPAMGSSGFVSRMLPDGALDESFGENGLVAGRFGFRDLYLLAVTAKPDGKIVMAGCAETLEAALHPVAIQLLSDGTLDTSFSIDGIASISTSSAACVTDIVVQPDNTLLLTANMQGSDFQQGIIAKLSASGELDTSFNDTGLRYIADSDASISIGSIALRHDGRAVAIGGFTGSDDQSILLVGLMPNGSIDSSISGASDFYLPPSLNLRSVGRQVLVQPDGDILMIVEQDSGEGTRRDVAVIRPFGDAAGYGTYNFSAQEGDTAPRHMYASGAVVLPDAMLFMATHVNRHLKIRLRDTNSDRITETWDVTPATMQLAPFNESDTGLLTSRVVTISGLEQGVSAPFVVTGAEYALNSPANFQEGYAWLSNGDQIQLRFQRGEQSSVRLAVGGTQNNNSPAVLLTDDVVRQATLTLNSEEDDDDGGVLGFGLIWLAVLCGAIRRKKVS